MQDEWLLPQMLRMLKTLTMRDLRVDQLRETPERSDSWIAADLGVHRDTVVTARKAFADVAISKPEYLFGRDGVWTPYAERKTPARKAAKRLKLCLGIKSCYKQLAPRMCLTYADFF